MGTMRPEEIGDLVERRLRFQYLTHSFTAAATLYAIPHNLHRVPLRWVVAKNDNAAVISGTDDSQNLNLEASATATVTLEII